MAEGLNPYVSNDNPPPARLVNGKLYVHTTLMDGTVVWIEVAIVTQIKVLPLP